MTGEHLFWSVDRDDWVAAGDLEPLERVRVLGATLGVVNVSVSPRTEAVYNLEVDGMHVYRVTAAGVLVHNASASACLINLVRPGESGFVGPARYAYDWIRRRGNLHLTPHHAPQVDAYVKAFRLTAQQERRIRRISPTITVPKGRAFHRFASSTGMPAPALRLDVIAMQQMWDVRILAWRLEDLPADVLLHQLRLLEQEYIHFARLLRTGAIPL